MKKWLAVIMVGMMLVSMVPTIASGMETNVILDDFQTYSTKTDVAAAWGRALGAISVQGTTDKVLRMENTGTLTDLQVKDLGSHLTVLDDLSAGKVILSVDVKAAAPNFDADLLGYKINSTWYYPFSITGGGITKTSLGNSVSTTIADAQWHNLKVAIDLTDRTVASGMSSFLDGKVLAKNKALTSGNMTGIMFKNATPTTYYEIDNFKVLTYNANPSITASYKLNGSTTSGGDTDVSVSGTYVDIDFSEMHMNTSTFDQTNINVSPVPPGPVTYSGSGQTCRLNFASLGAGITYTITVTDGVESVFGQRVTESSVSFTTVAGANVPPSILITSPLEGTKYTPGDNVSVTATASDSDGTVSQVEFFDGATSIGIDTSSPYTAILTNIIEGNHIIKAVATDDQETTAETQVEISASVNQLPAVAFTFPTDGIDIKAGSNLTLMGTVSDPDADGIQNVVIFNGVEELGIANVSGTNFSYIINDLQLGTYNLKAVATDGRGGEGEASKSLNVLEDVYIDYEVSFEDGFENYSTGIPTGWTGKTTGGTVKPISTGEYGLGVLAENNTGTGNESGIEKLFETALEGYITLEADIRPGSITNNRPIFYIKDSGNAENKTLMLTNDGKIKVNDSTVIDGFDYVADSWYHIKIAINLYTKNQSIYINDTRIIDNLPIANTNLKDIKSFKIVQWDANNSMVIDNVKISIGQQTLTQYEFVNNASKDMNICYIVASYKNGQLVDIQKLDGTIYGYGSKVLSRTVSLADNENDYEVKVFLWNTMQQMVPLVPGVIKE